MLVEQKMKTQTPVKAADILQKSEHPLLRMQHLRVNSMVK